MLLTLTGYLIQTNTGQAWRSLVLLFITFLVPSVVFSLALLFGVERYFTDYYFSGNLITYSQIYAELPLVNQGMLAKLARFPAFLNRHWDFLIGIVVNGLLVVGATLVTKRMQRRSFFEFPG